MLWRRMGCGIQDYSNASKEQKVGEKGDETGLEVGWKSTSKVAIRMNRDWSERITVRLFFNLLGQKPSA